MRDADKTKEQLITELEEIRQRVSALEASREERKRAEEALKVSETKYQDLYDNAPDMYASVDPNTAIILRCNQTTANNLGYAKGEIVGRSIFDMYHPDCMDDVKRAFQSFVETGRILNVELQVKRKDGTRIDVLLNVSAVYDDDGNILYSRSAWRDITERKRAEEALQKSQASLAKAQQIAHVGSWERNVDDTGRYWSDEMFRIFGLEPRQVALTRKEFYNLIHPDDREFVNKSVNEAVYENKPFDMEYRIVWADGSIHVVHLRAEVTFDEDGKPLKIHGMMQDITERRRAEEEIVKFKTISDHAPWGASLVNLEARLIYVNESFASMHGYTSDELIGQRTAIFYSESDIETHNRTRSRILKDGISVTQERWRKRKDGDMFLSETHITPVKDEMGRIIFMCSMVLDITERKQAEEALRVSEHNFRNSLDDSPLGVSIVSVGGELLYANQAILDIYGYRSVEELRAVPVKQRYTSKSYALFQERKEKRKQGKPVPSNYEVSIVRKDEKVRNLLVFRKQISWGGKIQFQALYQDITEQKRVEKALVEEKERLAATLRSTGDGVITTDVDGNVVLVNRVAEKLTGWTQKKAAGKSLKEIFHVINERTRQRVKDPVERVFKTGRIIGLINHAILISRDGTERIIADSGAPIHDEYQNILGVVLVFRDITKLRQAEMALIESEARLAEAQTVARIGSWDLDLRTNKLIWSNEHYRIFGLSHEVSLSYEIFEKTVHPEDVEFVNKSFEDALKRIKPYDIDFRIILPGDGERTIHSIGKVDYDNKGQSIRAFGTMQDITERKRAEEEIVKFKTISDQSSWGTSIADINGKLVYVNESFARMHGYTPDELTGQRTSILYPEEERDTLVRKRIRIIKDGIPFSDEQWRRRKDGSLFPSFKTLVPIKDKAGNTLFVAGWIIDITERKRAEELLRDSEEKYRLLFENIMNGFALHEIVLDERGKPVDYTFLEVNSAFEHLIGLKRNDLIGKRVTKVIPGIKKDTADWISIYGKVALTGQEIRFERYSQPFGKWYSVLAFSPKKGRFAVIFEDITEHKRAEEERQKITKLESIGILAGGIAHDFNNLLVGVMMNISLAKRYVKPKGKAADRLLEAEKACLEAKNLTRQLLTFARGEAPVRKTISIVELIKDTTRFVLRGSNTRCEFSLPDNLWVIEADEGQMNQIITNLVINADEAMPSGGILSIGVKNTELGTENTLPLPQGKYVEIVVEDHGTGISQEHLNKVFDPYFTTKQKGSGLGLSTVYSVIVKHDGHITVESELGIGTTFRIYLPASKKRIPREKEAVIEPIVAGHGKILVMDDEKNIREIIKTILTEEGYDVEIVSNGSAAVKRYIKARESGQPFDMVILDLTVPGGMGGLETIKELLKIDSDVKAIASSGYSSDLVMGKYRKYGFSGVLGKPYVIRELSRTVQKVLQRKSK